jgi:hypothetical protein
MEVEMMQTRSDLVVNIIAVVCFSIAVGLSIWAIYRRSRISIGHVGNPALLEKDMAAIRWNSTVGTAMAVSLGVFIFALVKTIKNI